MKYDLKSTLRDAVDHSLKSAGLQRSRRITDYRDYLPFHQTMNAAEAEGFSVGEYAEINQNIRGSSAETLQKMADLGVFERPVDRVCEIGPGTGRYLEKTLGFCKPSYYEIYETAELWREWLVGKYNVVPQPTDGTSLASTPSASLDFVHAHKVFVGLPTLHVLKYLDEMARVTRDKGKVVFDIGTEDCFEAETFKRWIDNGLGYQSYPSLMPKQFAIGFLKARGLTFQGSFMIPMPPGKTECMVFSKEAVQ